MCNNTYNNMYDEFNQETDEIHNNSVLSTFENFNVVAVGIILSSAFIRNNYYLSIMIRKKYQ